MSEVKSNDNQFLGTEKIGKLIRMFAIPCVLSLIIQALYNIVDQLFIGNCLSLGKYGNTATGVVYPLTIIALAIGLFLGDGAAAYVSIAQGKNDTEGAHKAIGTSITVGLIVSFAFMAVGFIFKAPILRGFGANDVIFPFAADYADFIIGGFPFFIIACVLNPIIRADGSPKYAMLSMAIGAIINIILDPIFIFVLDMGMMGAALATFIAQIITFVLSVVYIFRAKTFRLSLKSMLPNLNLLSKVLKLGISSFLTQISIVIISVVNNNILLRLLPDDISAIGLFTIAFKVFGIVISIAIGIACGGQPIIGYNYGANNLDRVKAAYKRILIITTAVGVIATLVFECIPDYTFRLFGYATVSSFGINIFRIYLSLILLTCLTKVSAIFFQSVGMPVKSTLISTCRDLIFLVPLALVLSYSGNVNVYLLSAPISDVLTAVMTIIFITLLFKRFKKVTGFNGDTTQDKDCAVSQSLPEIIITATPNGSESRSK